MIEHGQMKKHNKTIEELEKEYSEERIIPAK